MSQLTQHTAGFKERVTFFSDILLPVPIPQYYTYRVPYQWNEIIRVGRRVIVQFGPKKILTGIVVEVHQNPPKSIEAKYLLDILDEQAVINSPQFELFKWMASYYMCTEGQVLQVAMPSGLKLSSQSKIQIHPEYQETDDAYPLHDQEYLLIQALKKEGALD